MAVAFKELGTSPTREYETESGVKATREILVLEENETAMVMELLGSTSAIGGRGRASLPGFPEVFVKSIKSDPFQPTPDQQAVFTDILTQQNTFVGKFRKLTVAYEPVGQQDPDNPDNNNSKDPKAIFTYEMDHKAEYVKIPNRALKWQRDSQAAVDPDATGRVRVTITEHKLTFARVVSPPWNAIRKKTGCVNAAGAYYPDGLNAVPTGFAGAEPECLLFLGCQASKEFIGLTDFLLPKYGYKLVYTFHEKAIYEPHMASQADPVVAVGWNHNWCAARSAGLAGEAGAGWDRLLDYLGNTMYRGTDFNALFDFQFTPGS